MQPPWVASMMVLSLRPLAWHFTLMKPLTKFQRVSVLPCLTVKRCPEVTGSS